MPLLTSWTTVESAVEGIGVAGDPESIESHVLRTAEELTLISIDADEIRLTEVGEAYFQARFVLQDREESDAALAVALKQLPVVNAFCETLCSVGDVPKSGAVRLIMRLDQGGDENSAKRWLEVMNRGRLISYNKSKPTVGVLYNPRGLVEAGAERSERVRSHLLEPTHEYGNILALREMIRGADTWIRWYEAHLPAKVLEVLYRELERDQVSEVRLLSGPANIDEDLRGDLKRFKKEMKRQRNIVVEWRVLSKKETFKHHDRFFLTNGMSRNIPPLNSILANSAGEILPSEVTADQFDAWWGMATTLEDHLEQDPE